MNIEYIKSILKYDKKTGNLIWKITNRRMKAGKVAGNIRKDGYIGIGLNGKHYLAHRIIWFITHNSFPKNQIDHINHIRSDNRIENLREVNNSENQKNQRKGKTHQMGVFWRENRQKWMAYISSHNKRYYLGSFANFNDAVKARKKGEVKYGFHINHGN